MEEGKTQGKLIVISGPSGCGKTTILERLLTLEKGRLNLSVSATTRPPRAGEIDGESYHFLSAAEFDRLREEDDFLECVEVYPELWYGTLRSAVRSHGQDLERLLDREEVAGGETHANSSWRTPASLIAASHSATISRRTVRNGHPLA